MHEVHVVVGTEELESSEGPSESISVVARVSQRLSRTRERRMANREKATIKTDTRYPPLSAQYANPTIKEELKVWREKFKVADAVAHSRAGGQYYTAADACAGGGLSTLAAQRAGFKMEWLSESCLERRNMLAEMCCDATLIDDHFKADWKAITSEHHHINVLSTGMPCRDHSSSGSRSYADGETGHMYAAQLDSVLLINADVVLLEQSVGVLDEPGMVSVNTLITGLRAKYLVHDEVIECWRYGDVSNRKRLFIIGINKRLSDKAHLFKMPEPAYDEARAPQAWMLADKDSDVAPWLWREDHIDTTPYVDPKPGRLHSIGVRPNIVKGAIGFSLAPNSAYSFCGTFATQLRYGGGGVYPPRDYKCGDTVGATRLITLREALRVASLPSDYEAFATRHGPVSSIDWSSDDIKYRRLDGDRPMNSVTTRVFTDDGRMFQHWASSATRHVAHWKGSPPWADVRIRQTLNANKKVISEDRRPDDQEPHVRAAAADGWRVGPSRAQAPGVRGAFGPVSRP